MSVPGEYITPTGIWQSIQFTEPYLNVPGLPEEEEMEEDFYCVIAALEELADHYGIMLPASLREDLKEIIEQEHGLDDYHLPDLFEALLQFFPTLCLIRSDEAQLSLAPGMPMLVFSIVGEQEEFYEGHCTFIVTGELEKEIEGNVFAVIIFAPKEVEWHIELE